MRGRSPWCLVAPLALLLGCGGVDDSRSGEPDQGQDDASALASADQAATRRGHDGASSPHQEGGGARHGHEGGRAPGVDLGGHGGWHGPGGGHGGRGWGWGWGRRRGAFHGHDEWRGHRWVNGGWYPAFQPGVLIEPQMGVDQCVSVISDEGVVEACRECVLEGGSWDIEGGSCV